jgi:hypothetical protein
MDRIADPEGEGSRAFLKVYADSARAMADAMDAPRRARAEPLRRHPGQREGSVRRRGRADGGGFPRAR